MSLLPYSAKYNNVIRVFHKSRQNHEQDWDSLFMYSELVEERYDCFIHLKHFYISTTNLALIHHLT